MELFERFPEICYLLEDRRQKCDRKFAFCSCVFSVLRRREAKWERTLYKAFHPFFYVNRTHKHDIGSSWGALWALLSGKTSENPLKWWYFNFVWQVQLCEFVSLWLTLPTDGINYYFSRHSVISCWDSFDSGSIYLAPDPAGKLVDVGIDSRFVFLSAAVSPAHHTADVVTSVCLAHQGSTWVTLQRDKLSNGIQTPRLSIWNTHLTGVSAPLQSPRA